MIIFSNPGRVVAMETSALPIRVTMECWNGKDFKAIITAVSVSNQGGYQFIHSLRDYIYVYIFGERIGELTVSGVTFMGSCDSSTGGGDSGIEAVLQYYEEMRATKRLKPVDVQIGITLFKGFLLSARADITDASTGLGQFAFKFHFPPDNIATGGSITCPGSCDTGTPNDSCGGDIGVGCDDEPDDNTDNGNNNPPGQEPSGGGQASGGPPYNHPAYLVGSEDVILN